MCRQTLDIIDFSSHFFTFWQEMSNRKFFLINFQREIIGYRKIFFSKWSNKPKQICSNTRIWFLEGKIVFLGKIQKNINHGVNYFFTFMNKRPQIKFSRLNTSVWIKYINCSNFLLKPNHMQNGSSMKEKLLIEVCQFFCWRVK